MIRGARHFVTFVWDFKEHTDIKNYGYFMETDHIENIKTYL